MFTEKTAKFVFAFSVLVTAAYVVTAVMGQGDPVLQSGVIAAVSYWFGYATRQPKQNPSKDAL